MRYDDASQTGSTGHEPVARPDVEQLPAGSFGPASGNAITGAGTSSGASGADSANGATIVGVHGAGGQAPLADGTFQATGQFGVLSMDAQGNFNYVRNAGTPEGVQDVFNYTLANASGSSTSSLTIGIGPAGPTAIAAANVLNLPAGVEMSDIHVNGRDLVIDMPDGTQMVIPGGAVFVPQIAIGDVQVPPTNLAALLIDSEPQPTAGPPPSSGGNFADPVPPLDPGVPLGDLIPPTELGYTPPTFQEIFPGEHQPPTVVIITPDNPPPGVVNASESVDEAGLPTRNGGEPAGSGEIADGNGSNDSDPSETNTGTIVFTTDGGFDSITVDGVAITQVGQTIQGQFGVMTITGIDLNSGQITYSYTLSDNTSGDNTNDLFTIVVTDKTGDTATGTLTVDIIDDVPTARNDTDSTDLVTHVATGNVMTGADTTSGAAGADTVGADNASLTAVSSNGTGQSDSSFDASGDLVVDGTFGTLVIKADGSYTYTLHSDAPGGSVDVFTYTLTDGDGDTSQATLTITNPDHTPTAGDNLLVQLDDDALPGGNPGGPGDTPDHVNTTGTLSGSGGDGALTFALSTNGAPSGFTYQLQSNGDLWVLQGSTHVLTVTVNSATGAYDVTQVAPIMHPPGDNENNVDFSITYTVTDADGDSATSTLQIQVNDDTPTATNDTDSVDIQTHLATGNVVTGVGTSSSGPDSAGADGGGHITGLSSNNVSGHVDNDATGGFVVVGQYGTLTMQADGSYSYAQNPNVPGGVTDVFTYSFTDADGDTVTATLTITNPDHTPTIVIETPDNPAGAVNASESVNEKGLPERNGNEPAGSGEIADGNGTNNSDTSETNTGTIVFSAQDGVASVKVDGTAITTVGQVIHGTYGDMTITSINLASGEIGYSYTLLDNTSGNNTADHFSVVVTDTDGDTATATLTVNIIDDVPTAHNDTDTLDGSTATGNVITGADTDGGTSGSGVDVVGADNSTLTAISSNNSGQSDTTFDGNGNLEVHGQFGTLTIKADGSYVYTLDQGTHGGADEVFTYTITDGDGDTSTATLTIPVPSSDNPPTADSDSVNVSEEGLVGGIPDSNGSPDTTNSPTASGSINPSDPDGDPMTITLGTPSGSYTSGGQTVNWAVSPDGHTLVGYTGADSSTNHVVEVVMHSDGTYDVTLVQPFDDPNVNAEDSINFVVPVNVSDGTLSTDVSITVTVEDDSPTIGLSGADIPTLTVDETDLSTDSTASFAGLFTGAYGADGAGSVAYTLGISSSGVDSGLIDTASGNHVFLFLEGGEVVGREGTSSGTAAAGPIVFTVSVDSSTGEVTLDQLRAVVHPDGTDPDTSEPVSPLDSSVTLTATITDADGDHASQTVNLGDHLVIQDDGPTIHGGGTEPQLNVDETNLGTDDTQSFAGAFSGSFGADGAGSIAYSLSISSSGVDSGLIDTATGNHVFLFVEGGEVVGREGTNSGTAAGGPIVFTVSIDTSTGDVTLDQSRAVVQPTGSDPDTSEAVTLSSDGLVTVNATITDKDGDSATASVDIGKNLNFHDDGPAAQTNGNGVGTVTLDETRPEGTDTSGGAAPSGDASATINLAAGFVTGGSVDYGADGPGSVTYALHLTGTNVASGLYALDPSDESTADGDGYGKGAQIVLNQSGNTITGSVGATVYFTITIDPSTGVATFTQVNNIWNPTAGSSAAALDDTATMMTAVASALQVTQTVTDGDGDSSSASINIGQGVFSIEDDGPRITSVTTPLQIDNTGPVTGTGDFVFTVGTDQNSTTHNDITNVTFDATVAGNAVTNAAIAEASENATSAVYNFSFDYDTGSGTDHETGTLTFDKVAGTYTVTLDHPIQAFTILDTAGAPASAFVNYDLGAATTSNSPTGVAEVQLASDFWIQFSGVYDKTGSDHLGTTQGTSGAYSAVSNANTIGSLDLFTQLNATVTVSSSAAGVAGNTIQGGEVLDFNLYTTNQEGFLGNTPDQSASSMFIKLDGVGGSEDMIIILKLLDTSTGKYSEVALMVQNGDIITQSTAGQLAGTAYSGITLDSNDGLIVIEANDYQNGNSNLVIVGAQIAGSDDGITGQAANFNGTLGASGGSDFVNTQSFQTDVSDAPFKISDIGFITQTSTDQSGELNFGVTVTDADGDTATQTITVDVGVQSAAVINNAATTMSVNTTLSSDSLVASNDNGGHKAFAAGQNAALMGVLAAVGLDAEHGRLDLHALSVAGTHAPTMTPLTATAFAAAPEASSSVASSHVLEATLASAGAEGTHDIHRFHDMAAGHASVHADNAKAAVVAELLHSSAAVTHASGASASAVTAHAVAMPSAQQLAAAAAAHAPAQPQSSVAPDAQHNQVVGKVLADALHGGEGHGPNIDHLVESLSGHHGGGSGAIAALASHGGAHVSMGDMGFQMAFGSPHAIPMEEAMHVAAPPAHG